MLRVSMMASGAEIVALSPEEFDRLVAARGCTTRALKEHLELLVSKPRFRQKLGRCSGPFFNITIRKTS